jgi:hypothetical protein
MDTRAGRPVLGRNFQFILYVTSLRYSRTGFLISVILCNQTPIDQLQTLPGRSSISNEPKTINEELNIKKYVCRWEATLWQHCGLNAKEVKLKLKKTNQQKQKQHTTNTCRFVLYLTVFYKPAI